MCIWIANRAVNLGSNPEERDQDQWVHHCLMWYLLVQTAKAYISFADIGSTEALNRVVIVAPPQNASVVLGHPAVMECMAQGQPKPLVSWSRQGNTGKLSYTFLSVPIVFVLYCICLSLSVPHSPFICQTHAKNKHQQVRIRFAVAAGVKLILAVSCQLLYPALSHALHKVICHINSFAPPPFVHTHPYTHMKC